MEGNIKMDLRQVGCENGYSIKLALVTAGTNQRVP